MGGDRSTRKTGNGYCLLPWRECFREGNMRTWPDAAIAVLPVIAAHANANRNMEAMPGYGRISALAQISKSTVKEGIDALIAGNWLEVDRRQGKSEQNVYRLIDSYDKNNDDQNYKRQWIRLDHKLILNGVWGAMSPATRRAYLIFRAFAWAGLSAVLLGYEGAGYDFETYGDLYETDPIEVNVRGKWVELDYTEVQFLPEHIYDPAKFAALSGVPKRTFRDARAWLLKNGLICPYVEGEYYNGKYYGYDEDDQNRIRGLVMPFNPGIQFPHVLEAMEKAKVESAARWKGTPGGKRGFAAMLRRSS